MRIINKTNWRTDQLKALVRKVAEQEVDKDKRKQIRVHVEYRKTVRSPRGRGLCGLSGQKPHLVMWLYLDRREPADPVVLAHTLAHEFAHNHGLRHREMMQTKRYGYAEGWSEHYAWAKDFPIEAEPEKSKPSAQDQIKQKLLSAQQTFKLWERKRKLAETKLKIWKRKVHYYERRLAALTSPESHGVSYSSAERPLS